MPICSGTLGAMTGEHPASGTGLWGRTLDVLWWLLPLIVALSLTVYFGLRQMYCGGAPSLGNGSGTVECGPSDWRFTEALWVAGVAAVLWFPLAISRLRD